MESWRSANLGTSSLRYKLEIVGASPFYYPEKFLSKLMDAVRRF
jgi:hypothetical protein